MKVEHVLSIGANLGEGPLWSFITSAIMDLDPNERKKGPLSGDLFAVDLPIPGLPEPKFIRA